MGDVARLVEAIANKLPYSDGAVRRRMFAGGVLILGLSIPYSNVMSRVLGTDNLLQITSSPILLAALALVLYLTGTIIELLDQRFLVPVAALLYRPFERRRTLSSRLTDEGQMVLAAMPNKVRAGLEDPLGECRDLAFHHLTGAFTNVRNQRWCRRLVSHSSDVAVAATSVVTLIGVLLISTRAAIVPSEAQQEYARRATAARLLFEEGRARHPDERVQAELERLQRAMATTGSEGYDRDARLIVEGYLRGDDVGSPSTARLTSYRDDLSTSESGLQQGLFQNGVADGDVFNDKIEAARLARLEWLTNYQRAIVLWRDAAERQEQVLTSRRLLFWLSVISIPLVPALYHGYFVVLRNAIVTAIEGLVIERSSPMALTDEVDLGV